MEKTNLSPGTIIFKFLHTSVNKLCFFSSRIAAPVPARCYWLQWAEHDPQVESAHWRRRYEDHRIQHRGQDSRWEEIYMDKRLLTIWCSVTQLLYKSLLSSVFVSLSSIFEWHLFRSNINTMMRSMNESAKMYVICVLA